MTQKTNSVEGKSLWDHAGGRKFILSAGCGVVSTALLCLGKITQDVFQFVILWTVSAYITSNVTQKLKK